MAEKWATVIKNEMKCVLTQQQQCHQKQGTSEQGCSCDASHNGCTWERSEGSRDEQ